MAPHNLSKRTNVQGKAKWYSFQLFRTPQKSINFLNIFPKQTKILSPGCLFGAEKIVANDLPRERRE